MAATAAADTTTFLSAANWYRPLDEPLTQIWFRGRANLAAVTAYLLANEGMSAAREIILSGGSAGATTVFTGADAFRALVPPAIKVVAAPDAGFFLDLPRATNSSFFWYRDLFIAALPVWNATASLSPGCLAAFPDAPHMCFLAQYNAPFITVPLYLSNSALDMWSLGNVLEVREDECRALQRSRHGRFPHGLPQCALVQELVCALTRKR